MSWGARARGQTTTSIGTLYQNKNAALVVVGKMYGVNIFIVPEPKSKTILFLPNSTITEQELLSREGTHVPDPKIVTFTGVFIFVILSLIRIFMTTHDGNQPGANFRKERSQRPWTN